MKTTEELANNGNEMTDREKAICILSTFKENSEATAVLCHVMNINKDVAVQATLDIRRFSKEATEVMIFESKK